MTTIHELQLKLAEKNIEIKKKNLEITALQKKVWAGNRAESELARRNEELSEAQDKIAALKRMTARMADERNRNVEAKFEALAELGEWKQTAANALQERDLSWWGEVRLKSELDELQAKLVEAQNALDGTGLASGLDAGWTPPNPSAEGDGLDRTTSGGRVESEA